MSVRSRVQSAPGISALGAARLLFAVTAAAWVGLAVAALLQPEAVHPVAAAFMVVNAGLMLAAGLGRDAAEHATWPLDLVRRDQTGAAGPSA